MGIYIYIVVHTENVMETRSKAWASLDDRSHEFKGGFTPTGVPFNLAPFREPNGDFSVWFGLFETLCFVPSQIGGWSTEQENPASLKFGAGVPLKVTSTVELKITRRMAAKAGGTVPPTEQALNQRSRLYSRLYSYIIALLRFYIYVVETL